MKILLCEDDANIATIASLTLEKMGQHSVKWVNDGEEALKESLSAGYDVILLDDMMPKMSGVDVCKSLLATKQTVAPVIFMSANPQEKRVDEFKPLVIGYIPKPFDPMSLNEQIVRLLEAATKQAV